MHEVIHFCFCIRAKTKFFIILIALFAGCESLKNKEICDMKKVLGICLLWMMSHWTYAQKLTLSELKALKADYNPDIVQVTDSAIAYPVTGLIHIDIRSSLMGRP